LPDGIALASHPVLHIFEDFVDGVTCRSLVSWAGQVLDREGAEDREHGASVELPAEENPALLALTRRVEALVGFESAVRGTVRFRRYDPGQGHPPHLDTYEIDGASLVVTALLTIEAPESGGATEFPHASPWPAAVVPRAGRLAVWKNCTPEGAPEPRSTHQGAPVTEGRKSILLWFFYLPLDAWRALPRTEAPSADPMPPAPGTVFTCVDDGVPGITVELLRLACARRGILFRHLDARALRYAPEDRLPPCSMLYRPATSTAACHAEDFLLRDDVASFYDGDPLFPCTSPQRAMERAGLNLPRSFPVASADAERLAQFVERLGGYPVVVKVGGGEGGVGVLRADNEATLRGMIDYLVRGQGRVPVVSAYIPDAMHFRVIVVGDRAVACYENPLREGDFRSEPSEDRSTYRADVPDALASPAIRATRALRLFFGGVDLLRHPSGRVYVLEVNFPCFFPQATLEGGVDVAGPMLDFLTEQARRLNSPLREGPGPSVAGVAKVPDLR
jgi:hypothetical protein